MPASASTGVAELLRGPVRPARVLMTVPAAVYLQVSTDRGSDVVGVLTSDAARLPLGCVLFRPSNGRPLVALPSGAPALVGGGRIVVGDLAVSAAAWWNPRPRLPSLRPRCCPRAYASCATRSTAKGYRTARSRCPACRPAPAARWPRCAAPCAAPTWTRRSGRPPG